jgi:hypothetical protein
MEPGRVNVPAVQQGGMLGGPILTNNSDEVHMCKKTGGIRKVCGRATQQPVAAGLRRFDVIDGDRTDDE